MNLEGFENKVLLKRSSFETSERQVAEISAKYSRFVRVVRRAAAAAG